MPQELLEIALLPKINAEQTKEGLIPGVKLVGLSSKNGRSYAPAVLREAIAMYEGAPVNVNHPEGSPDKQRGYQERLGRVHNVRFVEGESTGLFADLTINPKHPVAEQLLWDVANAPENAGLSHNIMAECEKRDDGILEVKKITKVLAVDLVADPGATNSLFESDAKKKLNNPEQKQEPKAIEEAWQALTVEHLNDKRPDLVQQIQEQQTQKPLAIIEELFQSKLPAQAWDQTLFNSMVAADSTQRKSLIEQRLQLVEKLQVKPTTQFTPPISRTPEQFKPTEKVNLEEFAKALK